MSVQRRPGEAVHSALPQEAESPHRAAMGLRPRGLIVSNDDVLAATWAAWLEWDGLEAVRCPGPGVIRCPRLAGSPCGYRELADVTIVDVRPRTTLPLYEHAPGRSCTTDPDDGRTVYVIDRSVEERSGVGPQLRHPVARAGLIVTARTATG